MEILLQNNSDPNIQISFGETALICASNKSLVSLLLEYGADQTIVAPILGNTAMHHVAHSRCDNCVRLLLDSAGVDIVFEKTISRQKDPT